MAYHVSLIMHIPWSVSSFVYSILGWNLGVSKDHILDVTGTIILYILTTFLCPF